MPKNIPTTIQFCSFHMLLSRVMLKFLQTRRQQYMNWELQEVQARFRKGKGTRDLIASIRWLMEKTREFQKKIYFCFTDYGKAFDYVDHNKLWKILKQMGIPDHLTYLPRNLYAGQEATVRSRHGTMDWFKIGKEIRRSRLYTVKAAYLTYMQSTQCWAV